MTYQKIKPRCSRIDCFGNQFGFCTALKPEAVQEECGYYKNKAEWASECEANIIKLTKKGRIDLLDKYKTVMVELGLSKGQEEG